MWRDAPSLHLLEFQKFIKLIMSSDDLTCINATTHFVPVLLYSQTSALTIFALKLVKKNNRTLYIAIWLKLHAGVLWSEKMALNNLYCNVLYT